jgi:hypothetical protein
MTLIPTVNTCLHLNFLQNPHRILFIFLSRIIHISVQKQNLLGVLLFLMPKKYRTECFACTNSTFSRFIYTDNRVSFENRTRSTTYNRREHNPPNSNTHAHRGDLYAFENRTRSTTYNRREHNPPT